MVLPKKSFYLLKTVHQAPTVRLASGKQAASRRSDTFWVQNHQHENAVVAVVRRNLAVLHDNTHDSIPSPQRMREVMALEMVGAILCRPVDEREKFAERRTAALRGSIARIRGLCKVLRGRLYFSAVPGLTAFVEDMEDRFSEIMWQREVYEVVHEHLQQLRNWEPHVQSTHPKLYRLDEEDRISLIKLPQKVYPDVSDASSDRVAAAPIICLHRIHTGQDI